MAIDYLIWNEYKNMKKYRFMERILKYEKVPFQDLKIN